MEIKAMTDLMQQIQTREALNQFNAIGGLILADGFQRAPKGRQCPECQQCGHVWLKILNPNRERHICTGCGWRKDYHT